MTTLEIDMVEQFTGLSNRDRRGVQRLRTRGNLMLVIGMGLLKMDEFYVGTKFLCDEPEDTDDDQNA